MATPRRYSAAGATSRRSTPTNFNVRNAAERAAINMPVQGTAADIIKVAMNRLDAEMQRREMRSLMTLQVHDELIFECPGDELEDMRRLCLDIMPRASKCASR